MTMDNDQNKIQGVNPKEMSQRNTLCHTQSLSSKFKKNVVNSKGFNIKIFNITVSAEGALLFRFFISVKTIAS